VPQPHGATQFRADKPHGDGTLDLIRAGRCPHGWPGDAARMRRLPAPALVLLAGALLMGCSDGDDSSSANSSSANSSSANSSSANSSSTASSSTSAPSAATGTAAVCSSLVELQSSVSALADPPIREGGIPAAQAEFTTVQQNAEQVVDDAQDQYAGQADQLSTDVSAVQSALSDATSTPSTATLQAVSTSIRTLKANVTSFAGDVGSTC
jgi:hypothetical protein